MERILRVLSRIFGGLLVAVTILFAGTSSSFAGAAMPNTQQKCEESGYQWFEDKCCIYYSNKLGCITDDDWSNVFGGEGCEHEAGYIDDNGDFHCCPGGIGDSSTHLCCTPPEVFDIAQEKCVMGGCPYNWYWNESTGQCCVFYYYDNNQNDYVCITEEEFKNDIFPGIEDGCENPPYNNGQQAGYVDEDGNWQCCPPGTIPNGETYQCDCGEPGYVFDPQAAECVINCGEGYFLDGECKLCDEGYYCPGDNNMHECAAGTYTDTTGQSSCSNIAAGYYGSAGATSNHGNGACARGSYSAAGASVCTPCTGGTNTSGTGSTSASACTAAQCTNSANVQTWNTTSWNSNNTMTNLCSISTCTSPYVLDNNACVQNTSSTVTVTLDDNGGSGGSSSIYTINGTGAFTDSAHQNQMTTSANPVAVPTKTGDYAFLGYYDAQSGGNQIIGPHGFVTSSGATTLSGYSSNTTLWAHWSSSCYVIPFDNSTYCDGTGRQRIYTNRGSGSNAKIYLNPDCTGEITTSNPIPSAQLPGKEHGTFEGYYTVYTPNGATPGVIQSNGTRASIVDATLILYTPWIAACSCNDGWQGSGSVSYHNSVQAWSGACTQGVTITLDDNGGVTGSGSGNVYTRKGTTSTGGVFTNFNRTSQMTTGSNGNNPVLIPTKNGGYAFDGYYSAASGGTQYIDATGHLTSAGLTAAVGYGSGDTNVSWYAHWNLTSVTVTLNNNSATGGSCDASVDCTPGASCALPQWNSESCNINKGSKIFVGWTTIQPANHDSNTTGVFNITGPNSATTYYAVWQDAVCNVTNGTGTAQATTNNAPLCQVNCSSGYHTSNTYSGTAGNTSYSYTCAGNSYAVHFNGNCPTTLTGSMSNQSFTYGQSQNLTANAFSCEGYGFAGWADSADGAKVYDDQQLVSDLITSGTKNLYAKWDTNTITCAAGTYLPAGGTSAADCTACTLGSYCPGWTGAYDGNEHGRSACQGRGKYTNTTSATSCKNVSSGYYSTGCDANGNTCTGQTQCTGATYCSGGIQHNCPDGYTDNTSNGKTSASSCRIQCAAGTRVIQKYGQCVTDNDDTWVSYANTVYYGSLSTVTYCGQGTRTSGTAATDHDAASDCKGSVPAGHYASSAALSNVTAIKIYSASQDLRIVELAASASAKGTISDTYPNFLSPSNVATGNGIINPAAATDTVYNNGAFTTVPQGAVAVWDGLHIDNLKGLRIAMFAPENSNFVRYRGVVIDVRVGSKWINIFHGDLEQDKRLTESKQGYSISTGGIRDAVCDAGKYTTSHSVKLTGTSSCTKVTAGYWNNGCGTTATGDACSGYNGGSINAGYYGDSGATSATGSGACAIGSYSTGAASACTVCPDGTTTSSTGSTSASACSACSNAANVSTWLGQSWSANSVSGLCVINTCSNGYLKTDPSPYTCEAGVYAISLDSDFYSSASASATTVDTGATPTTIYEKYNTGWYQNNAATTPFTELNTMPAYGNRLFYGFWTGKTGTGTKIINSDGSLADATATVFSNDNTAYAKWSAANVCTCTTGTNVSSCSSTGVTNNKCQYTYNCASGYTIDGSATAGTFEGSVGEPDATSPACSSAGNYSITYVLNGGLSVDLATYTPVEYVSSKSANSAFSYFDTPTKFNFGQDFRVVGAFSNPSTSNRHILLGSYYNDNDVLNLELMASPTGAFRTWFANRDGVGNANTTAIAANTWTGYNMYYDPVTRKSTATTSNSSGNLTIQPFSVPQGTGEVARAMRMFMDYRTSSPATVQYPVKMKATAIYKNNELVNYYVPVRNSNNVCGMYDAKNNSFKASDTAAAFDCPSTTTMPTSFTYDTGATISGVPVRAHSQFAGWCTDSALTQGCAMTKTITANSTNTPQTFYAKWTCDAGYHLSDNACVANSITLSWTTAHGTAPSSPSSCSYGGTFAAPAAITGMTGYTFGGWSVNGNTFAAGANISCNEISLGAVTGTVSIAAVWTAHTYTVTFDTNGASGSPSVDSITCTYGQNCPAFASQGTMSSGSDNFGGWNTAADGSGTTYAEGATPSNLTSTDGATIIMYAIWTQTVVTCGAGYYLPANSSSASDCAICTAGNYCPGGNNFTPSSNSAQGINACPSGLTTPNDTETKRHDEAGDCGRPFHLGTDTLWLRSSKKTHTQDSKLATVALNFDYFAANGTAVKDGGTPDGVADLFLNLSTTASPMPTTNKNFKMTVNGSTVYGCDDGTCR